jgi:hypothetical protein
MNTSLNCVRNTVYKSEITKCLIVLKLWLYINLTKEPAYICNSISKKCNNIP